MGMAANPIERETSWWCGGFSNAADVVFKTAWGKVKHKSGFFAFSSIPNAFRENCCGRRHFGLILGTMGAFTSRGLFTTKEIVGAHNAAEVLKAIKVAFFHNNLFISHLNHFKLLFPRYEVLFNSSSPIFRASPLGTPPWAPPELRPRVR